MSIEIIEGDALTVLKAMPAECAQTCVTSPPYWGLRDYGIAGQLGLERRPEVYLKKVVAVFREVRRVLRADGTLWLNMGDSYTDGGRGDDLGSTLEGSHRNQRESRRSRVRENARPFGLGKKQLLGMPWRVAFALQEDGWILRSDNIWAKSNPMPESVTDRPTKAHEYLFLFAKNRKYYYDQLSVKEPTSGNAHSRGDGVNPKARNPVPAGWDTGEGAHDGQQGRYAKKAGPNSRANRDRVPSPRKQNPSFSAAVSGLVSHRNLRSVWNVATHPYAGAHFATFPPKLIEPCILAGCPGGGLVLDPFSGAGTTGLVCARLNRSYIGIELNPAYAAMSRQRIIDDAPLFSEARG